MDILVTIEEHPGPQPVLAHVASVPSPLESGRASRDVVTLYGVPTAERVALALAAAVESHRPAGEGAGGTTRAGDDATVIRHLGVWAERGAIGDAAWRDASTGELVSRDVTIPIEALRTTAAQLLDESGQLIQRLVAGLAMPDWPEGARRALTVSLHPLFELTAAARARVDGVLERMREADGLTFEFEGD